MTRRLVLEEWTKFEKLLVVNDPPAEVLLSMKMAFFGGVSTLLHILDNLSEGDDSQPEGIHLVSDIHDEVREFAFEMQMLALARKHSGKFS